MSSTISSGCAGQNKQDCGAASIGPATTNIISSETLTLKDGIESLPRELYDMIKEEVFTATPGPRIIARTKLSDTVDEDEDGLIHQPFLGANESKLLRVSRSTRKVFSKSYFNNIFVFTTLEHCKQFVLTLIPEHRALIKELWVCLYEKPMPHWWADRAKAPWWASSAYLYLAGRCYEDQANKAIWAEFDGRMRYASIEEIEDESAKWQES